MAGGNAGRGPGPVKGPAVPAPNNPLLNPGQPLSGQALYNAAQALTNAQTTGPLQELMRQIAINNRQGAGTERKTAGYFQRLGGFAQRGLGSERNISNQLNQQLSNISNQTQGQLSQFGQQAQQSPGLQGLAGTGLDGGALANLSAEIAREKGIAAQNAGTFRSGGAIQGANYRGLAASNLGSYALGGQERLGQIAQATRLANEPINAKIANLRATEGSLLAANEGKLRQQEIANRFTSKGLGLKQQALNITAQNNRANQSLRQQQINNTAAYDQAQIRIRQIDAKLAAGNLSEKQRHDLATERIAQQRIAQQSLPKTTATGAKTLTINEQNRVFSQIDQARALISQSKAAGYTPSEIRQALLTGYDPKATGHKSGPRFPNAVIDAAWALAGWGFLTNAQIRELNNMGVIVGTRYKRGTPPGGGLAGGGTTQAPGSTNIGGRG